MLGGISWLRWRFNLRTLLVAMALVAVVLGLIVCFDDVIASAFTNLRNLENDVCWHFVFRLEFRNIASEGFMSRVFRRFYANKSTILKRASYRRLPKSFVARRS
jgi:hypothetical protein